MMLFLCYPKCSTCQKAKAWLEERGISYDLRDIKQNNPEVSYRLRYTAQHCVDIL